MSLLVVGSVALDSVKTPFGEEKNILGGSAIHFSASASFFTPLAVVGVVGKDFPFEEIEFLKKRGVDLSGIEVQEGKTFHWEGEYGFDLNVAKTLKTDLNVFADFSPKIPEAFRQKEFLFLANIHPRLQLKVLEQVRRPKWVALDTMNFWIGGEPKALREVISKVDLVIINEGEARQLTGESSLVKAARKVQGWLSTDSGGNGIVVIKQGEYGALLFHGKEIFSAPGLPLESVKDPTGAGDSFAGGFLGFIASKKDLGKETLKQAVIVGSAMASLNVEEFSCRRLKTLTRDEIQTRIGEFETLAHFPSVRL